MTEVRRWTILKLDIYNLMRECYISFNWLDLSKALHGTKSRKSCWCIWFLFLVSGGPGQWVGTLTVAGAGEGRDSKNYNWFLALGKVSHPMSPFILTNLAWFENEMLSYFEDFPRYVHLLSAAVSALIDRLTLLPTGHNVEMLSFTPSLPTPPTNTNMTQRNIIATLN